MRALLTIKTWKTKVAALIEIRDIHKALKDTAAQVWKQAEALSCHEIPQAMEEAGLDSADFTSLGTKAFRAVRQSVSVKGAL